MKKKDIILIVIIVILAGALVSAFLIFANQEIAYSNANISGQSSHKNTNDGSDVLLNNNEAISNINTGEKSQTVKFDNYFKAAYLAQFTGRSNPPVDNEFNKDDKIVLSVRVVTGLKTDLKMRVKIFRGSKEISTTPEITILDGEVGLENPGKTGDYEARLTVGNLAVGTYLFTVR